MQSVITFRYIINEKSIGHRDIELEIPLFLIKKLVDSYWFVETDNFPIPNNKKNDSTLRIQHIINTFLNNCILNIMLLKNHEIFAAPLAVWDECTEYLVIEKIDFENLMIRYGWSEKGGVNLYSLSQNHFYIDTVNFTHGPKTTKMNHLIDGLKSNIVPEIEPG